jgi:ABC-type uncharacterized transport system auxiliary subunit
MTSYKPARIATLAAAFALAGALSACGDREAESETATSEAEVSTELPPEQMTDAQLKAAADEAAAAAAGGATTSTAPTMDPATGAAGAPATTTAPAAPAPGY